MLIQTAAFFIFICRLGNIVPQVLLYFVQVGAHSFFCAFPIPILYCLHNMCMGLDNVQNILRNLERFGTEHFHSLNNLLVNGDQKVIPCSCQNGTMEVLIQLGNLCGILPVYSFHHFIM